MKTTPVRLREFSFDEDYIHVLNLWKSMEKGMNVGRSDAPEEIQKKLQRDPDLFLVAENEVGIIGTVIGAFDGRRGMIYHLAIQKEYRGQGIGSMLLSEIEKRLQAKGCLKCLLHVFEDNDEAIHFYKKQGWRHASEDIVFSKEFFS